VCILLISECRQIQARKQARAKQYGSIATPPPSRTSFLQEPRERDGSASCIASVTKWKVVPALTVNELRAWLVRTRTGVAPPQLLLTNCASEASAREAHKRTGAKRQSKSKTKSESVQRLNVY
jgi:hypothetical protein